MIILKKIVQFLINSRHFFYRYFGLYLICIGAAKMEFSELLKIITSDRHLVYIYLSFIIYVSDIENQFLQTLCFLLLIFGVFQLF